MRFQSQPCRETTYTDCDHGQKCATFFFIPISWNHTSVEQHILFFFLGLKMRRCWRIRSSMARNTWYVISLTCVKPPLSLPSPGTHLQSLLHQAQLSGYVASSLEGLLVVIIRRLSLHSLSYWLGKLSVFSRKECGSAHTIHFLSFCPLAPILQHNEDIFVRDFSSACDSTAAVGYRFLITSLKFVEDWAVAWWRKFFQFSTNFVHFVHPTFSFSSHLRNDLHLCNKMQWSSMWSQTP